MWGENIWFITNQKSTWLTKPKISGHADFLIYYCSCVVHFNNLKSLTPLNANTLEKNKYLSIILRIFHDI